MNLAEYHSKKASKNIISKVLNYLLLTLGSSSITDIETIFLKDKILIKYFAGDLHIVNYNDVCFIRENDKITEIEFSGKRIKVKNILESDLFINHLKENILELGLPIKYKDY